MIGYPGLDWSYSQIPSPFVLLCLSFRSPLPLLCLSFASPCLLQAIPLAGLGSESRTPTGIPFSEAVGSVE